MTLSDADFFLSKPPRCNVPHNAQLYFQTDSGAGRGFKESEIYDETGHILDERLQATDEPAMDASEFLADLQERLRLKVIARLSRRILVLRVLSERESMSPWFSDGAIFVAG